MPTAVLGPIGIEITDLPLGGVDRSVAADLRGLLGHHGFVVLPGQTDDDVAFVDFLRLLGDLTFTRGETPVPDFPDLNVVSNVGRTTPPRSVFHVDTSYVRHPPAYTALRAVVTPTRGGGTLFADQYRSFDTLPPDVRRTLEGRTMRHVVTGLDLGADEETAAEHPIFARHPSSGRTAVYMSTPERCVSISGMGETAGREMIELLYAHSTAEDNIHRHAWAPGDVVVWDNRCVMHRADHADVVGDRVMHRGTVAAWR